MRKSLTCSCCGLIFSRWRDYRDQDQDAGYGVCRGCQDWVTERNNKENELKENEHEISA